MPTSVSRPSIWRPAGSSDSLVDAGAEADATSERAAGASTVGGPDSPPNSPLPKRLRVRLEASKEKHSAHAHLERRLRLAERIQVRARGNPRFQGFSPDNAFPFASGARGADARALAAEATLSPPDPHPSHGARPLPDSTTRARPRIRPVPNVVAPASWSEPPESGRVVTHPATSAPGFFCGDGEIQSSSYGAARLFAARLFAATAGFHASTYCMTRRSEVFTRS